MSGLFVTFEGIDGCGKSTQLAKAAGKLRSESHDIVVTREPGGTPLAEKIRSLVMDAEHGDMCDECEVMLYLAARAQHVNEVVAPALERGAIVLCDRFQEAMFAYQGYGRGIDMSRLVSMNAYAGGGVVPGLTFIFDIPVAVSLERLKASGKDPDRLESNPPEFFERVRSGYLRIAHEHPERVRLLDGTRSVEKLADEVSGYILAANA